MQREFVPHAFPALLLAPLTVCKGESPMPADGAKRGNALNGVGPETKGVVDGTLEKAGKVGACGTAPMADAAW